MPPSLQRATQARLKLDDTNVVTKLSVRLLALGGTGTVMTALTGVSGIFPLVAAGNLTLLPIYAFSRTRTTAVNDYRVSASNIIIYRTPFPDGHAHHIGDDGLFNHPVSKVNDYGHA